jgi:hypothetical protein
MKQGDDFCDMGMIPSILTQAVLICSMHQPPHPFLSNSKPKEDLELSFKMKSAPVKI